MTSYEIGQMLDTVRADYSLRHKFEQVLERTHDYDELEHRLMKAEVEIQALQVQLANMRIPERA